MAAEMIFDVEKALGERFVLTAKFRMALNPAAVLILFGPSGSGKTTLLRCLAGLESPEGGQIVFGGKTWFDASSKECVEPQQRQVGYTFQEYALFPTHTVAGNIGYGLGALAAPERKRRIEEVIRLLQLEGMEEIKPNRLSGGQQQRVALARAIARQPSLLLLDEPLSALDVPTRVTLRGELRDLLRRLAHVSGICLVPDSYGGRQYRVWTWGTGCAGTKAQDRGSDPSPPAGRHGRDQAESSVGRTAATCGLGPRYCPSAVAVTAR